MRKGILIGFILVFGLATLGFAATESQQVYSVSIRNNTGHFLDSTIPVTTIRPEIDKLFGYNCVPINSSGSDYGTETWVSIFDSTNNLMTGETFAEDEANDKGGCKDTWARGKWIVNGVAIRQGAFTDLNIYFIRK